MSWLKSVVPPKIKKIVGRLKKSMPEGLWHKCPSCQSVLYRSDLEKNMEVCPNCNFHNRISARERIKLLLDTPAQIEIAQKIYGSIQELVGIDREAEWLNLRR